MGKITSENVPDGMKLIGENDEFEFECQRCGSCCMNREDIIINSFDVFQGAKGLGIATKEFIEKYTLKTLGSFSKLPVVTLGHQENGMCHFLEFDYMDSGLFKCIINDFKPGACASHPLGLITRYDKKTNARDEVAFIKTEQCDNSKKPVKQKVKDWMNHYYKDADCINAAHEFINIYGKHFDFRKWFFMAQISSRIAAKLGHNGSEDPVVIAFALSCENIIRYTYENYDTSKPYLPQAMKNMELLNKALDENDAICHTIEDAINALLAGPKNEAITSVSDLIEKNDKIKRGAFDLGTLAQMIVDKIHFGDNLDEIKDALKEG